MRIETPLNEELDDLRVSDLYMPNSLGWDVQMLEELFVPRDVMEICNLPPRNEEANDRIIWQGNPNGVYTIKSGYKLATESLEANSHNFVVGDWMKLWNTDVPRKVRNFTLRAVCDMLPDRVHLQSRGVVVPYNCVFCDINPKNTLHLFV